MAKLTIFFGVLLIGVGVAGFVESGSHAPTALIPAYLGLILVICGALSFTDDLRRRMIAMHIAATVGVLGVLGTAKAAVDCFRLAHGVEFPHPIAVIEKASTCLLCLIFTAFCVRSFIEARRNRTAQ